MRNCKKCGALMSDDFVFCGKCGEPAEKNISHDKFIKTRKINRIRRFERKFSKSVILNSVFSPIWFVISAVAVFLFINTLRSIRASAAFVSYTYEQLILKYEYVREGLSASYISSEVSVLINYYMMWILLVFLGLTVIFGFLLAVAHTMRIFEARKGNFKKATEKLGKLSARAEIISSVLLAILFITSLILKGVV